MMKKIFLLFSIPLIVFTSCNFGKKQTAETTTGETTKMASDFSIPKVFFKKFQGKISDNQFINLYMVRNANSSDGDSIFHCVIDNSKSDVPQEYSGVIIGKDSFEIHDYSEEQQTEYVMFDGSFTSESTIKAHYYEAKAKTNYVIEFSESQEPVSAFPINYYKEHFEIATDEDMKGSMCDSFMAYVNLNILSFKSSANSVNKLNSVLDAHLNFEKNLREKPVPEMNTEGEATSILFFENNFITVQIFGDYYGCGAAHGQYGYTYYNYDLEKGDTISLTDIIPANSLDKLESICKQKFKKAYEKSDEDLEDFHLTHNYALLRRGLLFKYQPYEMGSFAEGAMEIFVPYNEIYGLLNSNSRLVQRLIHK